MTFPDFSRKNMSVAEVGNLPEGTDINGRWIFDGEKSYQDRIQLKSYGNRLLIKTRVD
ncbi:hypothetical protein M5585_27410 [Serratia ureilytica]